MITQEESFSVQIFFQIAKNTFRECIREPVYFLILLTVLFVTGTMPVYTFFAFNQQMIMVLDNSLALTLLLGFLAAALSATHCIRRELTNGTILLLLSKPVSRTVFIAAKVVGVNLAMALFGIYCVLGAGIATYVSYNIFNFDGIALLIYFAALLLSILFGGLRNYFTGASFSANCIYAFGITLPIAFITVYIRLSTFLLVLGGPNSINRFFNIRDLAPVLILIVLALIMIGTIAAAFATLFPFLLNLILCLGIFLLGLVSGPWLNFVFGEDALAGKLLSAIIPNWQYFWMSHALLAEAHVPAGYVFHCFCYMVIYSVVLTLWASVCFQNLELAKDSRT